MSAKEAFSMFQQPGFAENYKRMAEATTGHLSSLLLKQAGLDKGNHERIVFLDSACGTAVVSANLLKMLKPEEKEKLQLTCSDNAEPMLDMVRQRVKDEDWGNVEVKNVDFEKTPFPDNHFTHVIISFGVMLVEDPDVVMKESRRILAPGGTFAITTWKHLGWSRALHEAITRISPSLPNPTEEEFMHKWGTGHWEDATWLAETFKKHGFTGVKVTDEEKLAGFENHAACVKMTMQMAPQVTKHWWSEEQRKDYTPKLEPEFTKYISETYGEKSIEWLMVAHLTTGKKGNE